MQSTIDQWRALPSDERWLLVGIAVLLPAIGIALRLLGVRRTQRLLAGVSGASVAVNIEVSDESHTTAIRLGRLVNIAARRGLYTATCLTQSLALRALLCRRGMPAEVRVGVGRENGRAHAHAWVELAGRVINGRSTLGAEHAVYQEFDGRLARRPRAS